MQNRFFYGFAKRMRGKKEQKKKSQQQLIQEEESTTLELISYNNYNLLGLFEYNNTSKAFNILTC